MINSKRKRRKGLSLKTRMIFSHILPLIIVVLSVGFALTYLLETQVLLERQNNELMLQAALAAATVRQYPNLWLYQGTATQVVERLAEDFNARIMLYNTQSVLVATSGEHQTEDIGQKMDIPGFDSVIINKQSYMIDKRDSASGATEVLVPVITSGDDVIGVLRLIDPLQGVSERFPLARTLIFYVMTIGLTVGVIMAGWLASDLSRPLQQATHSIDRMANGQELQPIPEQGPSEVRELIHAFNTLTSELRSVERSRTRLLANLVHEIGRPLGALLSATQALEGGAFEDDEIRGELLDGMQGEIRRMQHLLDDLTRLYDQSQGQLVLHPQPTALSLWLTQSLSPWRLAAQEKGITWLEEYADDLPTLNIDQDRMAQAVGNIVSNAIKYTGPEGHITVDGGVDEKQVWISVTDTGIGIPEEELESIFEPFYRGSTSKRFPQGMGVGLSIAQDLTKAHAGHIGVESEPGVGSTFTLYLPLP